MTHDYTSKQGQYLAFIYHYTKIHRIAPADTDFQHDLRVSPPTVHEMILHLQSKGSSSESPAKLAPSVSC